MVDGMYWSVGVAARQSMFAVCQSAVGPLPSDIITPLC